MVTILYYLKFSNLNCEDCSSYNLIVIIVLWKKILSTEIYLPMFTQLVHGHQRFKPPHWYNISFSNYYFFLFLIYGMSTCVVDIDGYSKMECINKLNVWTVAQTNRETGSCSFDPGWRDIWIFGVSYHYAKELWAWCHHWRHDVSTTTKNSTWIAILTFFFFNRKVGGEKSIKRWSKFMASSQIKVQNLLLSGSKCCLLPQHNLSWNLIPKFVTNYVTS